MKKSRFLLLVSTVLLVLTQACSDEETVKIYNPATAQKAMVDRFSASAGHLMVRDASNGLPEANAPVDFDSGEPFITKGLGPGGEKVEYYNFDVMPATPAPIFVLFRDGETDPVDGQLNIIDVIPGDAGYNDFWQVFKVTVPTSYKANEVASYAAIVSRGYAVEATSMIVNCPVVPEGSTATKRVGGGSADLTIGWYQNKTVSYFNFVEKELTAVGGNTPTSPIYVCFNINPAETGGGPASGFKTEAATVQTHNVVETLPADTDYSPLWVVNAYDNTDFDGVSDLTSAKAATGVGSNLALVNCPIVSIN